MTRMSMTATAIGIPEWTVADRLRKAREARGWSQKELVDRSDGELTLRTVSNYESNNYDSERKRATMRSWAFATGVPLGWIIDGVYPSDLPPTREYRPLSTLTLVPRAA